ncbi:transcription initiation factor TFIID subunit 1 isoform X2 [Drosophila grimshawi]|uniref:transcription initiation factor TFIID subunit 1 isoform X2 n=1 Tax=Drosophila grimshawi TaxID=7222 RepID=UPI000C870050|nr:transcription initiation factor TFIID subunit 1 isoform X2 [Drosophila grimshawi]
MDTASDNDSDEGSIGGNAANDMGIDLTGILFGNIDSEGKLMDDDDDKGSAFDAELRENLSSLSKLGLDSLLSEVIDQNDGGVNSDDDVDEKPAPETADGLSAFDALKAGLSSSETSEDGAIKAQDDAIDYSDINELSEDCPRTPSPPVKPVDEATTSASTFDDLEDAIPATKVEAKPTKDDKELMPPPSAPMRSAGTASSGSEESPTKPGTSDASSESKLSDAKAEADRRLDTPLADILPSKYQNVNVCELFPDFRPQKVLRFSRLFGPGKPSSLPQIWRHVRKRRRKRNQSRDQRLTNTGGSDSPSDTEEPRRYGFKMHFGPEPTPAQCMSDDEDKLLSDLNSEDVRQEGPDNGEPNDQKPKIADWRYGPAQIWYDMLEVADSGDGFNYGFKTKQPASSSALSKFNSDRKAASADHEAADRDVSLADDAFLMVSQLRWEDDVVWDGNDIKAKVLQKLNSKTNAAGWLPSSGSRTAGAFGQPGKTALPVGSGGNSGGNSGKTNSASGSTKKALQSAAQNKQVEVFDDTWYSLFPVENEELIYHKWEDEVIWDAQQMNRVPKPKVLTLDPNDENIILGIPDDIDPSKINKNTGPPPKIKIPHPHVKKSKILLGKAGVINVLAEDTPPPPPKSPDRDPFNISNDSYYTPKTEPTLRLKVGGGNLIQHSTPVVELRAPFVPTHMGPMKLRSFHRPPLKKFSHGPLAQTISHPVHPLLKLIAKKAKQREVERIASGGGDVFFMRNPEDLSGKDGDIVLTEFCEEHPPLMSQVGMCSKIKNYYKRKAEKDSGPQDYVYGEVAFAHTSPFLGILHQGQCIQALENNMYRAPIYPHKMAPNDFLIIRTRNSYWIRVVNAIFTVGQECPLYEVPGPNSKRANNFTRDFLQVFIYRLFWKSRDNPRRIRMDDVKRAFPAHSESSIRKRLKQCADFKRTGMDSNWWVIKPEFRLPSEEEIRAMVSPEQCCAYFSMIAAEQRLKDAGYGEKSLFAPQEDDDEEAQLLDDEVKVAPWNTTRAYIQAMRGKCLLQLSGPADPTGCGEGFSYVRVPNKPTQSKEVQESQPKRSVTGTDADLRRLPLQRAKELLRKFKVPEEEIKKLTRWEVIDVVRTLSTEKAKAGEEGMDKFSRGNRFSIAEHQERYKEECQRIFDLQNRVLASSEVLSTDDDESSASEESDLEELGKNLENMLANKKTSTQLSLEREEQERQELLRQLEEQGDGASKASKAKEDATQQPLNNSNQGRILRITRTFKGTDGKEFTRVETVRRQAVIDAYTKIRTTKDEQFIKQFATLDEQQKEEMKREKRRIQEQLRRIKRNQERERLAQLAQNQKLQPGGMPTSLGDPKSSGGHAHKERDNSHKEVSPSRKKFKLKPDLKLKCGACGQVGHMRTNKACPLYTGMQSSLSQSNPSLADDLDEHSEKETNMDDDDLANVDGIKVTLSSKVLKRHGQSQDEAKRRGGLTLKVPKDAMGKKKRRMANDVHCDYLQRHNKTANRRRTDPVVVLSSILEHILNELRSMPDVTPFLVPVSSKRVPDYYRVIEKPMDLQTMREYIRQRRYTSRELFLEDLKLIENNSAIYNGPQHTFTVAARGMFNSCFELLSEREDKLMRLEKAINPLLDDDDQVALSFIFERLHNQIRLLPESWPFHKPVNKKAIKDYYTVIKKPMDLETIFKNIENHVYHSRAEYLADIDLIASNCEQYNGSEAQYTKNAKKIVEHAHSELQKVADHCSQLEENIKKTQEQARANAPEFEEAWGNDETDLSRSRASSPSDDYIDVEGHGGLGLVPANSIHRSMGADNNLSHTMTSLRKPSTPSGSEVKRGRGRPRKQRDPVEEVKNSNPIKRGRGRPRKDSLASNMSQTQAYFLDEDLQCSTDDDEDDEEDFQEVSEDENNAANILDQGERINAPSDTMDYIDPKNIKTEIDIETEQMADESMDVDPNYDPSDFLAMHKPRQSYAENYNAPGAFSDFMSQYQDDNGQYNPPEASTSAAAANMAAQDEELATTGNDNGMGIDEDLDISESDEEDDGGVRIKKEVFDDTELTDHHHNQQQQQHQQQQQQQSQIYQLDASNEPVQPVDYQPQQADFQPTQELEQLHSQPPQLIQQQAEQPPQQAENDYDWLTF